MSCNLCTSRDCPDHFLYVVNQGSGLVKIGKSIHPTRRYAHYRKTIGKHVVLEFRRRSGCEMSTLDREQKAIRALERIAVRHHGDWFVSTVADAIFCVNKACKGLKE